MKIAAVIEYLESIAPSSYQELYDNAGLLTGSADWDCKGILCSLDATDEVIQDAMTKQCNLIVAHHPIIFNGLKKINGKNYVERAVITAIKNDIAVYAIHTNLDNIIEGVNGRIADQLGLLNRRILCPKPASLKKLFTFVPVDHVEAVRRAIFDAGAGNIGNYSECSFDAEGTGTFKGNEKTDPFVGEKGKRHYEKELKLEVVIPAHLQQPVVNALKDAHPYEEVAYDVVDLSNQHPGLGGGMMGDLQEEMAETTFLQLVKQQFKLPLIRHTPFINRPVKKIAICGGAGSFLVSKALAHHADVYITADIKYHEFFDADGKMLLCDIGHYESEQFTTDLLAEILHKKFPTFAVLKSDIQTNPVHYYF
ncbi:MAG: Nif3-like dinuclear metal center hexameric protein [Chitinophagaceae bacterium]|nr:Nif3-like dinuclear metal center hexameric protein [Chitinophagaceae bacterium]